MIVDAVLFQSNRWQQITSTNGLGWGGLTRADLKPGESKTYQVPEPNLESRWRLMVAVRKKNRIQNLADYFSIALLQRERHYADSNLVRYVEILNRQPRVFELVDGRFEPNQTIDENGEPALPIRK
jgi:hypothetical protein